MAREFAATFREIGRDLLSLEINTIEKPNLSGRKMPVLPHALLDIADLYSNRLMKKLDLTSLWEMKEGVRNTWQPCILSPETANQVKTPRVTADVETFDRLRWAAQRTLASPEAMRHFDDVERVILCRIQRNCDLLKGIINDLVEADPLWQKWLNKGYNRNHLVDPAIRRLPLGRMPVDHAIGVRKIWDMGVENVYMQTMIQLDGDVITRIQSGLPSETREAMLKVHEMGIDISLRYWKGLFEIVKEVAGGLVDLFLPRRNSR
ncbi:MAG: hypothetical protein JXK94_15830 [Deltaproteobacteria bacterium]|nr:hypothetical protein [Deltaproteobacteria bacterium]